MKCRRYCDWRIKLPVGYQIVVNILDLDVVNEAGPTHVGYALSVSNATSTGYKKYYFDKRTHAEILLLCSSIMISAINQKSKS